MTDISKHIFISWLIFSILFFIAAYFKPFHVDEFYSWVYAERSSFKDILQLKKQFGIGHPPLYHLIQKVIQTIFQPYHHIHVRIANYLFGSLFVIIFTNIILKEKNIPFFCYGLSGSATLLEVYVFSRMWGLVCLFSLLLLWSGERYIKDQKGKYLLFFLGSCVLGFISDYSFIVLSPYIVIILFWRNPCLKHFLYINSILLVSTFILLMYRKMNINGTGITSFFYSLFYDSILIVLKTINTIFNFWFVEPLLIALLIFVVLFSLEIMARNNLVKGKILVVPFVYLSAIISFFKEKLIRLFDVNRDFNRFLITIMGAWLIILLVNPIFWTGIIRKRVLTILCPFILYIIFRNFNKKALYVIASVLFCSGLIFVSSNRIAGIYPSGSFDEDIPIIYENEWAYATQYLRSHKKQIHGPFIIDYSSFKKRCWICRMGTENIPFHEFDIFWVVWQSRSDPRKFIPGDFILTNKIDANLTWLDQLQFKYLTPLPKTKFSIFEYKRIHKLGHL